jgi:hypothetical protein
MSSENDASSHSTILDSAHIRDGLEEPSNDIGDCHSRKSSNNIQHDTVVGDRKTFLLSKYIMRANQKSKMFKAWAEGHDDDDSNSSLLNPNAMRGQRSLELYDVDIMQENFSFGDSMRTERKSISSGSSRSTLLFSPTVPFQVLGPSFAVDQRKAMTRSAKDAKLFSSASLAGRHSKPPLPPSST